MSLVTMSKRTRSTVCRICCFCGSSEDNELEFGKFYKHSNIVTHYYCLLLSSNMEQRGRDDEGILGFLEEDIQKELRRGKRLVCSYCKKAGATLGCCNIRCKQIFHYPCGLRAGTLNQFFGQFKSFCVKHRPKQEIDIEVQNEVTETNETMCYICYDSVDSSDEINTIWAPCCKKNAWFHRKCVQQLAVSAGYYFFKCPLCNDNKSFQNAMQQFGIFIPKQDASWELVPNAFQELLHRHNRCDAPICLCPKGRRYTNINAKWELTLCRTCGSQGIHTACGKLKWANPNWECTECTSILYQSKNVTSPNVIGSNNDFGSEDSDSDISVGKDSPVPFASTEPIFNETSVDMSIIKLRPGPRTYKLKQLRSAKMQSMQLRDNTALQNSQNTYASLSLDIKKSTDAASPKYSLPEHSKSVDNAVEVSNKNSTNSTLITIDDQPEVNNVVQAEKKIDEEEKNSSRFIRRESLELNNFKETVDNNCLTSNLNITEVNGLVDNSNVLEQSTDKTDSDREESDYACVDSLSNIKITNVMSLAPEEFENAPVAKEVEEIDDVEYLAPQDSNGLISGGFLPLAFLTQNIASDSYLKRKLDGATLIPTPLTTYGCKKMRRDLAACEQDQRSSFQFQDVKSVSNSFVFVNNPSIFVIDEDDEQVSYNNNNNSNNNNRNNRCTDILDSRNADYQCQSKQSCVTNKEAFNEIRPSEGNILDTVSLSSEINASTTLVQCEEKDNNNVAVRRKIDEENKIEGNLNVESSTKDCDADAGTSPATRSGDQSPTNVGRRTVSHAYPAMDKSDEFHRRTSKNDVEIQRRPGTDCNRPRLITDYIRLRDLKFHIDNSNNLQMIMYDKFLVNVNAKNAVAKDDTTVDPFACGGCESKSLRAECEIARDKERYDSSVDRDDAKENLDPVSISCKNVTDNSSTNTASVVNNLSVSMNSNNQCEVGTSTQSVYNATKAIEDNDRLHSGENVKPIVAESNNNASDTNSNGKRFKCSTDAHQNAQGIRSHRVTNGRIVKHNVKLLRRDHRDSIELFERDSRYDDRACNEENGRIARARCKVSIDLKKIENFIDDNPSMFAKVKNDDDKEYLAGQSNFNSASDASNGLEKYTLSLSSGRIVGVNSCVSKNDESIDGVTIAKDLVQKLHANHASFQNQKYQLKRSNATGRFVKQCIFDR